MIPGNVLDTFYLFVISSFSSFKAPAYLLVILSVFCRCRSLFASILSMILVTLDSTWLWISPVLILTFSPSTFFEFSINAIASRSQSSRNQWNLSLPAITVNSSGLMSAHILQIHFWQCLHSIRRFVSSSLSSKFRSHELQNPKVLHKSVSCC